MKPGRSGRTGKQRSVESLTNPSTWTRTYGRLKSSLSKMNFWAALSSIVGLIIAVVGIPAVVVTVQSCVAERRATRESAPARTAVVKQLGLTYSSLFYAAEYVIKPTLAHSPEGKYRETHVHLGYCDHDLKTLEAIVVRNNRALDARLTSLVSQFSDDAGVLLKQLNYFAELHNPQMAQYDFASEGPFAQLSSIAEILERLKQDYPDVLVHGQVIAGNLKSVAELRELWASVEKVTERLCLDPGRYVWKEGRRPCVFNPSNRARLMLDTNRQMIVYVMYGYQ
jgi:hypothetical protein